MKLKIYNHKGLDMELITADEVTKIEVLDEETHELLGLLEVENGE